jgi:hypothetical protein
MAFEPPWASLEEASQIVRAAGVDDPEETIRKAVGAGLLVRPGAVPVTGREYPAPRVRVISERTIIGNDWLQAPVLDFEKSEILCRSFMDGTQERFEHPRRLHPARIELWRDDLLRLWPAVASKVKGATSTVKPSRKGIGGRPELVDWKLVKGETFRLMEIKKFGLPDALSRLPNTCRAFTLQSAKLFREQSILASCVAIGRDLSSGMGAINAPPRPVNNTTTSWGPGRRRCT